MSGARLLDVLGAALVDGRELLLLRRLRLRLAEFPNGFLPQPCVLRVFVLRVGFELRLFGLRVEVVDLRLGGAFPGCGFGLSGSLRGLRGFTALLRLRRLRFQAGDFGAGVFQFAFAFLPA